MKITFARIIGKTVLIGLTYVNAQGEAVRQAQLHGRIAEARPEEGIFVSIEGQAEHFTLLPTLARFVRPPRVNTNSTPPARLSLTPIL